jgi:hypothetical protein
MGVPLPKPARGPCKYAGPPKGFGRYLLRGKPTLHASSANLHRLVSSIHTKAIDHHLWPFSIVFWNMGLPFSSAEYL